MERCSGLFSGFSSKIRCWWVWPQLNKTEFSVWTQNFTSQETIKTKVASDKEHIQSENISREKLIQREVIEFHPGARALLQDALTKTGLEQSNRKSRDVIVDAEVPDLWMKHMQLSVNLEMLRDSWHHVKGNKRRDTDHQQWSEHRGWMIFNLGGALGGKARTIRLCFIKLQLMSGLPCQSLVTARQQRRQPVVQGQS